MPRKKENPNVRKLLDAMERPNLTAYTEEELMNDLITSEAHRIDLIVREGLVVHELNTRCGISHRTIEDSTGIPKSTLSQWQKQVAA